MENKKFLAIPIKSILSFDQSIMTFTYEYINEIKKISNETIGNQQMYLTEEEIEEYI
ncbi:hypothetical protein [Spirochaeta cellobiosiphila]|uniref:hypothetical protein n=1 Tax=Spirochaeta cellobiosiphila TaxID=504483 RepID=UPI0003F4B23C|nr:hypothetical protein [Spirochaeta cellobiosiphila]